MILSVVLLMNMLIAMMGKSFDVVWESAAATYLAGFAQTARSCAEVCPLKNPDKFLRFFLVNEFQNLECTNG